MGILQPGLVVSSSGISLQTSGVPMTYARSGTRFWKVPAGILEAKNLRLAPAPGVDFIIYEAPFGQQSFRTNFCRFFIQKVPTKDFGNNGENS
jgi:hypothetical protein